MDDSLLRTIAPEFVSGNDIPVSRATISKARMIEILEAYSAVVAGNPDGCDCAWCSDSTPIMGDEQDGYERGLREAAELARDKARMCGVMRSMENTIKSRVADEIADEIKRLI